ncbi:hypothetical protein ACH5RR_008338 [Cinchona calisaya]|uniref:Uncharacterized protein n=1 Tax=Cinchona calisaya TaxID=153742 RepID=A0ABD3ADK9_9GENT
MGIPFKVAGDNHGVLEIDSKLSRAYQVQHDIYDKTRHVEDGIVQCNEGKRREQANMQNAMMNEMNTDYVSLQGPDLCVDPRDNHSNRCNFLVISLKDLIDDYCKKGTFLNVYGNLMNPFNDVYMWTDRQSEPIAKRNFLNDRFGGRLNVSLIRRLDSFLLKIFLLCVRMFSSGFFLLCTYISNYMRLPPKKVVHHSKIKFPIPVGHHMEWFLLSNQDLTLQYHSQPSMWEGPVSSTIKILRNAAAIKAKD